MATLNTRIVLRNDTAEQWQHFNPVLYPGEVGTETDRGLMKIGNGTTAWNDLPYVNAAFQHYEGIANENETDLETIARILGSVVPAKNDMFVVKRLIANDNYSFTAYIFNNGWAAMDGNYSAETIFFKEDIVANVSVGAIKVPSSGQTTIAAKGKTLAKLLEEIFYDNSTTTLPTITQPSLKIEITSNQPTNNKFVPTFSATFNKGAYSFGPETGIEVLGWQISDNYNNSATENTGSLPEITIGSNPYELTVTAIYSEGAIPFDSNGNAYEEGKIAAGRVTATATFNFKESDMFYVGALSTSSSEAPLTETLITSLSNSGRYEDRQEITIEAGKEQAKRIVVAYSSATAREGLVEALLLSAMGMDITSEYAEQPNVGSYKVFVYEPALLGSDEKHKVILG